MKDRYGREITSVSGILLDVQKGFHAALLAGFDQIKINVVLMAGFNAVEYPNKKQ